MTNFEVFRPNYLIAALRAATGAGMPLGLAVNAGERGFVWASVALFMWFWSSHLYDQKIKYLKGLLEALKK